jgi:hypothetical protein
MTPEDIDWILSSDDMLEPASGFVGNVMDRVRQQVEEAPPQSFPWIRFALGIISCVIMAASGTVLASRLVQSFIGLWAPLASLRGSEPDLVYATAAAFVGFGFISYSRLRSAT